MDPSTSAASHGSLDLASRRGGETGGRAAHPSPRPPSAATDDHALLRRMAAGDEAALAALYDRWSTLVHSVAAHVLADPDDAAEVVEETFWQAWRRAEGYEEGRGAVSTWLAMIARSRALDRVRSRRRAREAETPLEPAALAAFAAEGDPLQGAETEERSRIVAQALRSLPAEQRETVELAYFRGMSQTEIAAHTGQPLGTVKTRVRLAMQKLKDRLSVLREVAS